MAPKRRADRALTHAPVRTSHVARPHRTAGLRAHLHWFGGDGEAAWRDACTGVRSLEAAGSSCELASAYAQAAELSMLVSRPEETRRWGRRALQLAAGRGTEARALTAIGAMRLQLDIDDVHTLLDAIATAAAAADHEQVVLSLIALAYVNLQWVRPEVARAHALQARA